MTSLDFFPPRERDTSVPPTWSTGRRGDKVVLWAPTAPNWHQTGKPIKQFYDNTSLQRSNVRVNDELIPKPEHIWLGDYMIDRPFPAEHPYASHEPQFALFPKFAEVPGDPKRGVDARQQRPISDEMPANPYDTIVKHKIKGHGFREEVQVLTSASEKKPLHWHQHDFNQHLKTPTSQKQSFYPTPPKTFQPNLEKRDDADCIRGNMVVTPRAANLTRNLERHQWMTTYELSHTGLGPANPMKLDNYDDKLAGQGDKLQPRSVPTFHTPRPVDGRIARGQTAPPPSQTDRFPNPPPPDPNYERKPTRTELEEDRLHHGKDYVNLPDNWPEGDTNHDTLHPEKQLEALISARMAATETRRRPEGAGGDSGENEDDWMDKLVRGQHDARQQMEASNRWKVLESHTPQHDLTSLQHKLQMASVKRQPHVFYEHEGEYQEERAGLYKTSYEPATFQHALTQRDHPQAKLFDTTGYQTGVLDLPVGLNQDMHDVIRYSRTLGGPPGSVPQYHSQPSQYEAIGPFDKQKSIQRAKLSPKVVTTDPLVQEKEFVFRESTYGEGYNTQKFLQENKLHPQARQEPLSLMSHENQDLNNNVRPFTTPKIQLSEGRPSVHVSSRPWDSSLDTNRPTTSPENHLTSSWSPGMPNNSQPGTDKNKQFQSKASNFMPQTSHSWAYQSSYGNQFAGGASKGVAKPEEDEKFNWKPGFGTPRPQFKLLHIQNGFSKTDTKRKFQRVFSETLPDLRENIVSGRQHSFNGVNAQVLRGAPLVA